MRLRRRLVLGFAAVFLLPSLLLLPGCAWLAKQARHQLRLLRGRVPLEAALARPDLREVERERLREVPRIKEFGERTVGLLPTRNYETVNLDFDSVVWNVSGCAPDRFDSHVYRYPVVGPLPYIGFFDEADAVAEVARLESLGWEAWMRPAGAYSTLGWFRDPLWRSMLRWDVPQLANTVLHELAHATVWIPGEGQWNESFAAFVGDRAAELYLAAQRPELVEREGARKEDQARYDAFFHALVRRLEALYDSGLPREELLREKALLLDAARKDYRALPWKDPAWSTSLDPPRPLNNARLVQFRVYRTGEEDFAAALQTFGGDLGAFVRAARGLPAARKRAGDGWDPWAATRGLGR